MASSAVHASLPSASEYRFGPGCWDWLPVKNTFVHFSLNMEGEQQQRHRGRAHSQPAPLAPSWEAANESVSGGLHLAAVSESPRSPASSVFAQWEADEEVKGSGEDVESEDGTEEHYPNREGVPQTPKGHYQDIFEVDSTKAPSSGDDAEEGPLPMQHVPGRCKPCGYFHFKADGCRWGDECRFCHTCSKEEIRDQKKKRKTAARVARRRSTHGGPRLGGRSSPMISADGNVDGW